MLQKGQDIKCVVLEVNEEKRRISLGIKQMAEDPWIRAIPDKYIPGQIIKGTITKLTNFGAFVELEPDLEGLLHISELADHKIDKPQDVVKLGEEVEVKILRIDPESRKIGLSLRRARWAAEEHAAEAAKPEDQPADTLLDSAELAPATEPVAEQAPTTQPVAEEQTEDQETQQPEGQEAQQAEGQQEQPEDQAPQQPEGLEPKEQPEAEEQAERPFAQADEGEVQPSKESEQMPSPPQEAVDEQQAEEPAAQADEGEVEPSKESEQMPSPPQEAADEQQATAPEAEAKDKTDTDNQ
jgi:predicted RNA-binding protein with RPS1 domain